MKREKIVITFLILASTILLSIALYQVIFYSPESTKAPNNLPSPYIPGQDDQECIFYYPDIGDQTLADIALDCGMTEEELTAQLCAGGSSCGSSCSEAGKGGIELSNQNNNLDYQYLQGSRDHNVFLCKRPLLGGGFGEHAFLKITNCGVTNGVIHIEDAGALDPGGVPGGGGCSGAGTPQISEHPAGYTQPGEYGCEPLILPPEMSYCELAEILVAMGTEATNYGYPFSGVEANCAGYITNMVKNCVASNIDMPYTLNLGTSCKWITNPYRVDPNGNQVGEPMSVELFCDLLREAAGLPPIYTISCDALENQFLSGLSIGKPDKHGIPQIEGDENSCRACELLENADEIGLCHDSWDLICDQCKTVGCYGESSDIICEHELCLYLEQLKQELLDATNGGTTPPGPSVELDLCEKCQIIKDDADLNRCTEIWDEMCPICRNLIGCSIDGQSPSEYGCPDDSKAIR
jgi:hypothetical protein